jgi:hypothetical protein
VKALSPSAVIGLRDALTGDARATRVRQLATPSWLATRAKRVVERRAAPVPAAHEAVVKTASSTWSPLPRPEVAGFLACALCWCRREAERLRSARSESADDGPLGSLRIPGSLQPANQPIPGTGRGSSAWHAGAL